MDNTKPPEMPAKFKWIADGKEIGILLHLTTKEALILSSVLDIADNVVLDMEQLDYHSAVSVAETTLVIAAIQERLRGDARAEKQELC